jgi:hypothetical protein
MSQGRFNYFSLNGPNVIQNKPRYREEEYRKKNTYNFVTDPRLKRGRNYGIVYVTSTAFDENEFDSSKKRKLKGMNNLANNNDFSGPISGQNNFSTLQQMNQKKSLSVRKEEALESMGVQLPYNLESKGSMTTEIQDILPKPETFEMEVQTQDYIDRPQTPIFTQVKTGEDASTQIEKGELFDFDEEVEPIVNVLTFKTLEEARMEVLEEEEIKMMKQQMQDFEKVRNRELEIVQKLEMQTIRKEEEKNRRNEEREIRKNMAKTYQKKLISCVFSKSYLKNLRTSALNTLTQNVLKKPELNEYHTKLTPIIKNNTERVLKEEQLVNEDIDTLLQDTFTFTQKNNHKTSVQNEYQRKANIRQQKINELLQEREAKKKRRAERARKRHERDMKLLIKEIQDELFVKGEYVDEPNEIYNINSYNLKDTKGVQVIGGQIGQLALLLGLLKNIYYDLYEEKEEPKEEKKEEEPKEEQKEENVDNNQLPVENEENQLPAEPEENQLPAEPEENNNKEEKKTEENPNAEEENNEKINEDTFIDKFLELYLVKANPIYILYTNEELESYKQIDENIQNIEDILKLENEENYLNILNQIIDNHLNKDDTLPLVCQSADYANYLQQLKDNIKNLLLKIFKLSKTTNEFNPNDKIKFLVVEEPIEGDYKGLCDIYQATIEIPKPQMDITAQMLAKKKKDNKPVKITFDPSYDEKTYVLPTSDDKMKIMAINNKYERMLRKNFVECICKADNRFEQDKENCLNKINQQYDRFLKEYKQRLEKKYKTELLKIEMENPEENEANAGQPQPNQQK